MTGARLQQVQEMLAQYALKERQRRCILRELERGTLTIKVVKEALEKGEEIMLSKYFVFCEVERVGECCN